MPKKFDLVFYTDGEIAIDYRQDKLLDVIEEFGLVLTDKQREKIYQELKFAPEVELIATVKLDDNNDLLGVDWAVKGE